MARNDRNLVRPAILERAAAVNSDNADFVLRSLSYGIAIGTADAIEKQLRRLKS